MSNHRLSESVRAHFTYRDAQLDEISFPLGGIGSGSIGLAGNGRLIDWEIFNRPNKGSVNGFSHFAVKAERGGEVVDARVLHGDLTGPLSGSMRSTWLHSFGFGPTRASLGGLPHFADVAFEGTFPVATLSFADQKFPGTASPCAPATPSSPAIPTTPAFRPPASRCRWPTPAATTSTTRWHWRSPTPPGPANRSIAPGATAPPSFSPWPPAVSPPTTPSCGDLTIATDCADVSYQEYWFRGMWFDDLTIYWHDFTAPGGFANRNYPDPTVVPQAAGSAATTPGCWRRGSAYPRGKRAPCASC